MAEADPGKTFDMGDTATDLAAAIERAHSGEVIIILKDGMPYARLSPYRVESAETPATPRRRQPGRLKGLIGDIPDSVWFDPLPDDELAAWEGKYSNIP